MMECEGGEIEKIANGRMYFEFGKLFSAIKYEKIYYSCILRNLIIVNSYNVYGLDRYMKMCI